MVKRVASASDGGSALNQPQSRTSSIPSLPELPEIPQVRLSQPIYQRRNTTSPPSIPPQFSTLRRHHVQASTHAEPTAPTPSLAPVHPQSSHMPIASISTLLNDLRPTLPPFSITTENEADTTSIKKESFRVTEAKVETMKAESKARIDALGLTQKLEEWRVKEETKAKIKTMTKESETMLDIMRTESSSRIYIMKEESNLRMLREDGVAKSGEDANCTV